MRAALRGGGPGSEGALRLEASGEELRRALTLRGDPRLAGWPEEAEEGGGLGLAAAAARRAVGD